MTIKLRLATRGSDLALTQSKAVAATLKQATGAETELVIVKTIGDQVLDVRLDQVGGVGLFTKEVQQALFDGRADYAVHSLKDLPAEQVEGLSRGAVPPRQDARDCLLIREGSVDLQRQPIAIQKGAIVGTSAARRSALLADVLPDAEVKLLRGNVPTRVQKLRDGEYDAIILAAAGLKRLQSDLSGIHVVTLDHITWPGAPGQGALAVECRADDVATRKLLAHLHVAEDAELVDIERSLLRALGGGCSLPLGASASRVDAGFELLAALGPDQDDPDARQKPLIRCKLIGTDATQMVAEARALLSGEMTSAGQTSIDRE
ncbi:MAG: hydroxymethylbilane synthase [Planctomycetes bacterium]|nr:hydroxymethylbilane synthase [Planctomycetota bacterium]